MSQSLSESPVNITSPFSGQAFNGLRDPINPAKIKKRRRAITNAERKDLRNQYVSEPSQISEPRIKANEAIQLLKRLQLYEEQQEDRDDMIITRLRRYGRDIRAKGASKQQQTEISTYFTSK